MAPRLKALANRINHLFPEWCAVVYPAGHPGGGFCNTDRKISGRLRHPGKGRVGSRLEVTWRLGEGPQDEVIFEHNAAETYRYNSDVVEWINSELRRRGRKGEAA